MPEPSQLRQFYDGLNVLITGGTGFMGKLLVEKLLRSTKVSTIFLLIREKHDKGVITRTEELLDDVVFERLKSECPKFKHRVVGISGDCCRPGLGLEECDRQKLVEDVHVVFHVAATVRFHENIKKAFRINVESVGDILSLARHMRHFKSLIHVSTAYSNCYQHKIEEKIYDHTLLYENTKNTLAKISESEAEQLTKEIIGKWPNTYTFTKALAESLIRNAGGSLPVGIFRPAMVISTYKEPMPGWSDNIYGPIGICAAAALGLLRVMNCNKSNVADIVPADNCIAGLIVAAWDVASKNCERTSASIPVYNYVSSVENSITWNEFNCLNIVQDSKYPLSNSFWATNFRTVTDPNTYRYLKIIFHFIPALLIDFLAILCFKKPQLWTTYKKVHKFSEVVAFFSTKEWKFCNENTQSLWLRLNDTDRKLFPVSMTTVMWLSYFRNFMKGLRVYVMKDPLETLPQARVRRRRQDIIQEFIKFVIQLAMFVLFWTLSRTMIGIFTNIDVNNYFDTLSDNITCTEPLL